MEKYNPSKIEKKWQKFWQKNKTNFCDLSKVKNKFYNLVMFFYPSGDKIHIGHGYNYTGADVFGRYKKMKGFNVLQPMGYDAFGLPAENYAIKTGVHPAKSTKANTEFGKKQLQELGLMYDWSKEIDTSSPQYYKWTQWIFSVLYKAGLAYRKEAPVNWCPSCKTVLANEQVVSGKCERCDSEVIQKNLKQWFFKITDYAEKLLKGHEKLNWPDKTITMQKNWIGKSEGAMVKFKVKSEKQKTKNKRKPNVLIIHGSPPRDKTKDIDYVPYNKKHWIGWLADKLTEKGYKAYNPLMPNAHKPVYEEWKKTVDKLDIDWDDDSIVVATSAGAAFAVRYLAEKKIKINKLILLAPVKRRRGEKSVLDGLYDFEIDPNIKNNVKEIKILVSKDECPDYKKTSKEFHSILGGDLIWFEKYGHFTEKGMGKKEFPELLDVVLDNDEELEVFTTRPDTLFGATFMVVAPEHELIKKFKSQITNYNEVEKYIKQSQKKSDLERTDLAEEKTGVELKGIKAINPVNSKEIPIFVADYVLMNYGTGAIMAVPAHDERDKDFAKKYKIDIKPVIMPVNDCSNEELPKDFKLRKKGEKYCTEYFNKNIGLWEKEGYLFNSEKYNWLRNDIAKEKITKWLEKNKLGKKAVNYKLRDWLISRQRYWGAPIPMIYCKKCASRKTTVLLIHGFTGHSRENWFPWFKKEMENRGIKIIIPDLPNTDNPKTEEWLESLEQLKSEFEGDLIIIGHSLGAFTACKFIEKNNLPVKKLILVAPGGNKCLNIEGLKKAGFDESDIQILHNFQRENPNWKILNKLIENKKIYLSENDPYILLEKVKEEYQDLKSDHVILNKGHFNEGCGITEFPEILKEFDETESKGWFLVDEKDLPVKLPELKNFKPTAEGESPLARSKEFVNVKCPKCDADAKRCTETMDTFVCSSWYFLRFLNPDLDDKAFDKKLSEKWLPVDQYCGGAEHAVMHLMYARFITKVLFDQKLINFDEPFLKLNHQGMILAEDGSKMSKSKNNVVIPDNYVKKYGADVFRTYVLFLAPFEQGGAWSDKGILGVKRFLDRIINFLYEDFIGLFQDEKERREWFAGESINTHKDVKIELNKTIKKVTEDIENFHFNTAISQLMILLNSFYTFKNDEDMIPESGKWISRSDFEKFVLLLSPFAPHFGEELWHDLDKENRKDKSIFEQPWPEYDEKLIIEDEITLAIQVNGKVRDEITVSADISEKDAQAKALESEKVQKWLENKKPKKVIYIKSKLVSIVV